MTSRVRSSRTPRPTAVASSKERPRRARATPRTTGAAASSTQTSQSDCAWPEPFRLPVIQTLACCAWKPSPLVRKTLVSEESATLTPMPTSTKRCACMPRRQASAYTSSPAASPPPTAAYGTWPVEPTTPYASRPTTRAAAPCETPTTSGLASGLRATVWISAPASPSASPTSRPTSTRGSRNSPTTSSCSLGRPRTTLSTSAGDTVDSPRLSEATTAAASSSSRPPAASAERRCTRKDARPARSTR